MNNEQHPLICILGPTASGKTALAVSLAKKLNGAIISADSRQVFKGMDIGTGKDLSAYDHVPYHLVDILPAGETYSVAHFQDDFNLAHTTILKAGQWPILCGGSGLYIQSVLQDFTYTNVPIDPALRATLAETSLEQLTQHYNSLLIKKLFRADLSTKKRAIRAIEQEIWLSEHILVEKKTRPLHAKIFGIHLSPEERRIRITERLNERLKEGLIEEVSDLKSQGLTSEQLTFYGLEYKYVAAYLDRVINYDQFYEKLNTEIHRYAKRQMTYFRKMEKDGLTIHWLDGQKNRDFLILEIRQALSL